MEYPDIDLMTAAEQRAELVARFGLNEAMVAGWDDAQVYAELSDRRSVPLPNAGPH
jgi:hypothetical protein